MKTKKKPTANFTVLDDSQMKQIKGGIWVDVKKPDGTTIVVWV